MGVVEEELKLVDSVDDSSRLQLICLCCCPLGGSAVPTLRDLPSLNRLLFKLACDVLLLYTKYDFISLFYSEFMPLKNDKIILVDFVYIVIFTFLVILLIILY